MDAGGEEDAAPWWEKGVCAGVSDSAVASAENASSVGYPSAPKLLRGDVVSSVVLSLRWDLAFLRRLYRLLRSEPEEVLLYLVAAIDRLSGLVEPLTGEPRGVDDPEEEFCLLSAS